MSPCFPDTPHVYLRAIEPISAPNRWISTLKAQEGLRQIRSDDKTAWQELLAQMQRYARLGAKLNDPDLKAPVGQQFTPRLDGPQPWLGELIRPGSVLGKSVGEGPAQYRLYFTDVEDQAGQPPAQMLAGDCSQKWISNESGDEAKVLQRQDDDMEAAMRTIIYWCGVHRRGYRHAAE